MKRMKACVAGPVVLCASLLGVLSPGFSQAGVYDDTAAWWHFDYDPNHDPQAVNVAAADEIRDQRDWGTAAVKGASGRHASGVRGVLGGLGRGLLRGRGLRVPREERGGTQQRSSLPANEHWHRRVDRTEQAVVIEMGMRDHNPEQTRVGH